MTAHKGDAKKEKWKPGRRTINGKQVQVATKTTGDGKRVLRVSVGGRDVKVYERTTPSGYTGFQVANFSEGKRKLESFQTEGDALERAESIARKLSSQQTVAASISNSQAASYARAIDLLRGTGVPLEIACAHFAKACEVLGGDKVIAAAEFYRQHSVDNLKPRTVQEVVDEVMKSKEGKRSGRTVGDLKARLTKFADAFRVQIASVSTSEVQGWLDGLKVEDRTRKNYQLKVGQLFRFAERRGYIPKGGNPVAGTEKIEPPEGNVTTYTAEEIEKLLVRAAPEFRPCLAIGAFAGLRRSEIERLQWEDIKFTKGLIVARGRKRGTPSRRFVPLRDNLRAWLEPYTKAKGFVWMPKEKDRAKVVDPYGDAQTIAATAAEVPWKDNALRHSYISYRCAETENVAAVALECGNSEATIHKHYRELFTGEDAAKWFAVSPARPANVVHLKTA